MSVSLVAVFIPILLMGGIVGRLFREFAVTLEMAIGVSLLVSLTTTPMMCAKFLRPSQSEQKHASLPVPASGFSSGLLGDYTRSLKLGAAHQPADAAGHASHDRVLSVYLYIIVPKGFFPQQDTGRIMGMVWPPGYLVPVDARQDAQLSWTS